MGIFISVASNQVVPVDSTINEPYVIRCIYRALHQRDPTFLISAMQSLAVAMQHNYQRKITETNLDAQLDLLVPIIHTKCHPDKLRKALQCLYTSIDEEELKGMIGYSMTVFESGTIAPPPVFDA